MFLYVLYGSYIHFPLSSSYNVTSLLLFLSHSYIRQCHFNFICIFECTMCVMHINGFCQENTKYFDVITIIENISERVFRPHTHTNTQLWHCIPDKTINYCIHTHTQTHTFLKQFKSRKRMTKVM